MAKSTENNNNLNQFFNAEYQALKNYVRSKIDDSADRDAEDILQDVALNLFSREDHLTPINNIAGFVYRSIRNKIIDIMRAKKVRLDLDDSFEKNLAELAELFYGNSAYANDDELKLQLKTAILSLKQDYKEVILAIDFENHSYAQLSLETGIPQGTLMSRRHRALSLLYKELEKSGLTSKNEKE
ncbi:MAG: RNA polymerase sigma factor [Eudoraea sp.]|uniref:RNA polymerase sigma factor n=1 Tax=Eudoraea sp. TaxID=1979955 RepID=UPI003C7300A5